MDLRSIRERAWELGGVAASSSPTGMLVFHIRGSLGSQYLQAEGPWAALEGGAVQGEQVPFPKG